MHFSEILESMRLAADVWTATVSDDWLQGRSLFGGLQAALALKAMRNVVPLEGPLRTLQVTFLAPVPAGDVHVRAQLLRGGKNASHIEARLVDGTQVLCLVAGIFGVARPSAVRIVPQRSSPELEPAVEPRFVPGRSPNFTQHFTMRWLRGGLPFKGGQLTENVLELGTRALRRFP